MMREFPEFDLVEVCAELKIATSKCRVVLYRVRNDLRLSLERACFGAGKPAC